MAFDEFFDAGEGELRVLWLRWKDGPRSFAIVKHDAAKHAVVVENEGGPGCAQEEVVVLVGRVVGWGGGEFAGHAEVDFEVKGGLEGEEHAFAVGSGGEQGLADEDLKGGLRAIAENAGLGMGVDGGDDFVMKEGPLTAGEFHFCKLRHGQGSLMGMKAQGFEKWGNCIWHRNR